MTDVRRAGSCKDRKDRNGPIALRGTTLRVDRYLYRAGRPCGLHDIQRGLGLSSSSVALYHVRKLLGAGLIKEEQLGSSTSKSIGEAGSIHDETKNVETDPKRQTSGYVVDTVIFDNMIRIRRSLIPFQVAYAIFFATALGILLVLFRPSELSAGYLFALVIIGIAIAIFSHQAIKTSSRGSAI